MTTLREAAWAWFDRIVVVAPLADSNPWRRDDDGPRFEPDYETLCRLLAVPPLLEAKSQPGVPALALDVWVAYELRRAGFDADRVWPRAVEPRVLPQEALPKGARGSASANILGKHYVKQVDVVMSSWATGPELLISTKRMDSSFQKNAANRVEESYGDARNLRARHPEAALGFLYGLGATAFETAPDTARWLIDLLGKLGREADAYDAVGLIVPQFEFDTDDPTSEEDPAGPLDAGVADPLTAEPSEAVEADEVDLRLLPRVELYKAPVPPELEPGHFLGRMCNLVLDRTPINFHEEARERRRTAL